MQTITIQTISQALREIREAQQQSRVAHLYVESESAHDAMIGDMMVEIDDIDYAEQPDMPTDIWGDLDGHPFRASLSHG